MEDFDPSTADLTRFRLQRFVPRCYMKVGCLSLERRRLATAVRDEMLRFLQITPADPTPPPVSPRSDSSLSLAVFDVLAACPMVTMQKLTRELRGRSALFRSVYALKKELIPLCYMFSEGPFKHVFVRRGYDPRGDPGSLRWQAFSIETLRRKDAAFASKAFESVQLDDFACEFGEVSQLRSKPPQLDVC